MPQPLGVKWIHGSPDCRANADPPHQVHALDEATYVIRQNKCLSYEAPFIYLLLGNRRGLLLDSGAPPPPGKPLPIREVDGKAPLVGASATQHPAIERHARQTVGRQPLRFGANQMPRGRFGHAMICARAFERGAGELQQRLRLFLHSEDSRPWEK